MLQTVFDSIQEGIIVSDESGEFLHINPGAKEILDQEYLARRQGKWSEKSNDVYYYADRVTPIKNEDLPLPRAIFNGEATDEMNIFVRRPNHPDGGIYLADERVAAPGRRSARSEGVSSTSATSPIGCSLKRP